MAQRTLRLGIALGIAVPGIIVALIACVINREIAPFALGIIAVLVIGAVALWLADSGTSS